MKEASRRVKNQKLDVKAEKRIRCRRTQVRELGDVMN